MTKEEESAEWAGSVGKEIGLQVLGGFPWRLVYLCWDPKVFHEMKQDGLAKSNVQIWLKK